MITNIRIQIKELLLVFFLLLFSMPSFGQIEGLEIIPEDSIHSDLLYNSFNLSFIYLKNNRSDSLFLKWSTIKNDFDEDWYVTLCDNVLCYGVVPDQAEMYGIAPLDSVYIRLEVNPYDLDAYGEIYLELEEVEANSELRDTLIYTFLTKNFTSTSTPEVFTEILTYPNPFMDELMFTNPYSTARLIQITDMKGLIVRQLTLGAGESFLMDTTDFPLGVLNLRTSSNTESQSKLIIHIR